MSLENISVNELALQLTRRFDAISARVYACDGRHAVTQSTVKQLEKQIGALEWRLDEALKGYEAIKARMQIMENEGLQLEISHLKGERYRLEKKVEELQRELTRSERCLPMDLIPEEYGPVRTRRPSSLRKSDDDFS